MSRKLKNDARNEITEADEFYSQKMNEKNSRDRKLSGKSRDKARSNRSKWDNWN